MEGAWLVWCLFNSCIVGNLRVEGRKVWCIVCALTQRAVLVHLRTSASYMTAAHGTYVRCVPMEAARTMSCMLFIHDCCAYVRCVPTAAHSPRLAQVASSCPLQECPPNEKGRSVVIGCLLLDSKGRHIHRVNFQDPGTAAARSGVKWDVWGLQVKMHGVHCFVPFYLAAKQGFIDTDLDECAIIA
jgi:hypothetical protein